MVFEDRVAVITGAASGIGRGLACKAAALGMHTVIADVDEAGLEATRSLLEGFAVHSLAVKTDVSSSSATEALAEAAFGQFGRVHLLFNNAGILVGGKSWECRIEDWRWSLDVNVIGIVNGIKAFVPRMIEGGEDGVIVNTASIGALVGSPLFGPYSASKYAVAGITECLAAEFAGFAPRLRAACLCPGAVVSQIFNSERLRPADLQGDAASLTSETARSVRQIGEKIATTGIEPRQLAECAFEGIRQGKFWIFSHPQFKDVLAARHQAMMQDRLYVR